MKTLKNDGLSTIEVKTFIDKIHGYKIPKEAPTASNLKNKMKK